MEYLQYQINQEKNTCHVHESFKPYYKWNTFNTKYFEREGKLRQDGSFKPYYKWNTFNTVFDRVRLALDEFSFKPYYKWNTFNTLDLYKDIDFMVN